MKNQISINWNEAQASHEQQQQNAKQSKINHAKRIEEAKAEFYDRLASPNFSYRDFDDVLSDYELDSDDLFNALI